MKEDTTVKELKVKVGKTTLILPTDITICKELGYGVGSFVHVLDCVFTSK